MGVVTHDKININDVLVGDPEKMKSGSGWMLPIQHRINNNNTTLEIQGPPCRLPWSCGDVQEGYGGTGAPQSKIALQLDPEHGGDKFQEILNQIEDLAKAKILSNSSQLFGSRKKITSEQIAFQFCSGVKQSDPKYLPFLSAKMPFDDATGGGLGKVTTAVFTKSRKLVSPHEFLTKGAIVVPVVIPSYVWCISGRYGIAYRVNRVLLHTLAAPESQFDFAISDDLERQLCSDDVIDSAADPAALEGQASSDGVAPMMVEGSGIAPGFVPYNDDNDDNVDVGGIPVQ